MLKRRHMSTIIDFFKLIVHRIYVFVNMCFPDLLVNF